MNRRALFSTFAHALAVAAATLVALTGCSEDGPLGPGGSADNYVKANTPLNCVRRLCATYSAQDRPFYLGNLTADFRYAFSSQSDPTLVQQYGNAWGRAFEDSAARHLFESFVDENGVFQAGATQIGADFISAGVQTDPLHADSTRHYQLVAIAPLGVEILLSDGNGFDVANAFNFYVVRGDAAVLGAGQEADSTRWYVWRIDDLAAPFSSPSSSVSMPGRTTSWGSIRAIYLR